MQFFGQEHFHISNFLGAIIHIYNIYVYNIYNKNPLEPGVLYSTTGISQNKLCF